MAEKVITINLMDLISEGTTTEQFKNILESLNLDKTHLSTDELCDAFAYLGAFHPNCDIEAIGGVTGLSGDKLKSFIKIGKSINVLKDNENGNLTIEPKAIKFFDEVLLEDDDQKTSETTQDKQAKPQMLAEKRKKGRFGKWR